MPKWPELLRLHRWEALKKRRAKEVDACDWIFMERLASQLSTRGRQSTFSCTVATLASLRSAYASSDESFNLFGSSYFFPFKANFLSNFFRRVVLGQTGSVQAGEKQTEQLSRVGAGCLAFCLLIGLCQLLFCHACLFFSLLLPQLIN
jgi:hypothetical protein